MLVFSGNVVIYVIAYDCIKRFISKGQFFRIALLKVNIIDSFGFCILNAERIAKRSVFFSPPIQPCHFSLRIAFGASYSQRSASTANIKPRSSFGQCDIRSCSFNNPLIKFSLSIIGKCLMHTE